MTRKNPLIADPTRYIHYLGPTTCGSTHDYQLLKNEFAVNLGLLDLFAVLADLGYLGLVTDDDLLPNEPKMRPTPAAASRSNTLSAGPSAWAASPKPAAISPFHSTTGSWHWPAVSGTGI